MMRSNSKRIVNKLNEIVTCSKKQILYQKSKKYLADDARPRYCFYLPDNCTITSIIYQDNLPSHPPPEEHQEVYIYTQDSIIPVKYDLYLKKNTFVNIKIERGGVIMLLHKYEPVQEPVYIGIYYTVE